MWSFAAALISHTASVKVQNGVITLERIRARQKLSIGSAYKTASILPQGYEFTSVDEADAQLRNFKIAQSAQGTKYTSPSGPVLLLSKKAAEGSKLFWRFRVTGNNSWSIGVIPDSKRSDNEELFRHGKVGLDSTGLSGGVLPSQNMHGSWVSVSFDNKTSTAKFRVKGDTIEQKATFKGPVRLALSTFSGTIVTISTSLEEEKQIDADRPEIRPGAQVELADDYADYGDASSGPLEPGKVGILLEDDGSSKPYKVQAPNGKKWWYRKEALVLAGSTITGKISFHLCVCVSLVIVHMPCECANHVIVEIFDGVTIVCAWLPNMKSFSDLLFPSIFFFSAYTDIGR